MRIRLFIAASVSLCAICNSSSAQEPLDGNRVPAPDLRRARVMGLQQSRYRQRRTELPATVDVSADSEARRKTFEKELRPILQRACFQCHGSETIEGNLRIDTLDPNLITGEDVSWWTEVQAVLNNSEMPPPDSVELNDEDRIKLVEWLSREIQIASTARRTTEGGSSFRRLTRYEYNYAMQDLLGLPLEFAKDLPPEAHSDDGFQNSSEMLHMSATQLETYRQIARKALRKAVVRGDRPEVTKWQITMKEAASREFAAQEAELKKVQDKFKDDPEGQKRASEQLLASYRKRPRRTYYQDLSSGRKAEATWAYRQASYAFTPTDSPSEVPPVFDQVAVIPSGRNQYLTVELGDQIPNEGIMRVRVRASRTTTGSKRIPCLQLHFGFQASNEGKAVVRVSPQDAPIKASAEAPEFYQWDVHLSEIYPRNSFKGSSRMGGMPSPSEFIRFVNSSVPEGGHGDIVIDYVEVMTAVNDEWPPPSHKRIFQHSVDAQDETAAATAILTRFMKRAFRRAPTAEEVQKKVTLFSFVQDHCDSFEDAILEVLATVLSSPKFLYVVKDRIAAHGDQTSASEQPGLSDSELATRLSLFLWCSIPDDKLLALAANGQLSSPDMLMTQVNRMLADPRSERFAKHFVHQWLDLQLLEFMHTKKGTDPALKESMQQEPVHYFRHVLRHNASVLDFLHSDYAVIDERLARHYQLPDVRGNDFRPVSLDPDHSRGGLLTQSGLLAMNSDGTDSHPLKRGVWLLKSILNDPPPPPPPAVPEIDLADPEIAKMTLKEKIEDHRNHPACMSCHSKIDPWGIAFENYDAMGRYREQINGHPVDASSLLFNDQELDGMQGLKEFLMLNRQDQFARSLVYKLATYALGRPLTFSDHAMIDRITSNVRQSDDGLKTMIHKLIISDLFLER